jgi:hypothetical protein
MADYGFVHDGKVFTPNQTAVDVAQVKERNASIERAELERWQGKPDRMLAYYKFPAEHYKTVAQHEARTYRRYFEPLLSIAGLEPAIVTTWLGTKTGRIIRARVYSHNFGGRMLSITVQGTNGATYYGRASWDNGTCINLRRAK